jgi:ABC-type branched-subunit amino acid transport system substrate-binding protein
MTVLFAHAFGVRYDLPIPLVYFITGGAGVVFLSFLVVLPRRVEASSIAETSEDGYFPRRPNRVAQAAGVVLLALLVFGGITGSQAVAENIISTTFWLVLWIAVPISCGVLGNWTQAINPFATVARWADNPRLRRSLLGHQATLRWPRGLGFWPAVVIFFAVASGELIFNATAVIPNVTAIGMGVYFIISALGGLVFGAERWLTRGEMFSVLLNTWGRIGYFRFGAPGRRGFLGGLAQRFEPSPSRITFVLLMLMSVTFDGLLATPSWKRTALRLPSGLHQGTNGYLLIATLVFIALVLLAWGFFSGWGAAVRSAGGFSGGVLQTTAGLIPSLVPIAFGYLVAHNLDYLAVNGQLLIPLAGNPAGYHGWKLLPYPFSDAYEIHKQLLPPAFIWYFQVALIVAVHIAAVVLAHRFLANRSRDRAKAQRSEWPWIVAMVGYTMTSLWLLAQPVVQDTPAAPPAHPAAAPPGATTPLGGPARSIDVSLAAQRTSLSSSPAGVPLRIGAVFPMGGSQAPLARQELAGVQIAARLVNQQGGVNGRPIQLVTRDLRTREGAPAAIASLRAAGVPLVIGAYSSQLSIAAANAAAHDGLAYWETGATADRLTGQGNPMVFRVGITGGDLGINSATYAATQIAPRMGKTAAQTRVAVIWEDDAYGTSVAQATIDQARAEGMPVVLERSYDAYAPHWAAVMSALRSAHADVLMLASYIPDGVAFRRNMLADHVHVGAFVGTTMAECSTTFGSELGSAANGIFASDRPDGGFNKAALTPEGLSAYQQLQAAWHAQSGQATPSDEVLAGFSGAWALFHDVLPSAHSFSAAAIATAARATTLAQGDLPNGAGLQFSTVRTNLGQNVRAAGTIAQWQVSQPTASRTPVDYATVWPPLYATTSPTLVPLPR